jgi:hypothetical protein
MRRILLIAIVLALSSSTLAQKPQVLWVDKDEALKSRIVEATTERKLPLILSPETIRQIRADKVSRKRVREIADALNKALGVKGTKQVEIVRKSCRERQLDNIRKFCAGGECARINPNSITLLPLDCQ